MNSITNSDDGGRDGKRRLIALNSRTRSILIFIAVIIAATIFTLDFLLPLGVAGGVPYVALVLLGTWFSAVRHIYILATISSVLIVLGYFLSPDGGVSWIVFTNRGMALFAVWVTAILAGMRKKSDERLHQEQNRLASLLTSSPSVIYTRKASNDYAPTFVSDNVTRLLGYKPADFIDDPGFWANGIHPEDAPRVLAGLQEELFAHGFHSCEYRFRKPDGSYIWVDDNLNLIYDFDGEPKEIVGAWADITERKHARQEINDRQERTRAIVDTVVDGIITIDEKGIIETFNPAAERIFGYTLEEVVNRNVKMLMPAPYQEEHDGYLHSYMASGEAKIIGIGREVSGLRKDGKTFPMELAVSEMKLGKQRMFTGVVRDITDRRQADRAKGEFVSTVSHELRTPLTSIKGSLGLIRSGAVGELPDKLRAMLDIAYSNSDRLVLLINDILDMEKIRAGKMDYLMVPIGLVSLVDEAILANKGYGDEHGVTFVRTAGDMNAMVEGDKGRLMQVLSNLMSNAAKFSPDGERVEMSVTRNGPIIRVAVKDNGPGIPDEFRKTIFEKFSQADSSDTRKKGGTGLGLSISRTIVEQHGGSIGFDSKAGEGSTFFIDLPELTVENDAPPRQPNGEGRPRILHIEDDESILRIVSALVADNADVVFARTLSDARARLDRESFDLVIMDLILPDGDGETLLPMLNGPGRSPTPVIVFSARDISREARAGINALLIKSQTANDVLLDTIRSAIGTGGAG